MTIDSGIFIGRFYIYGMIISTIMLFVIQLYDGIATYYHNLNRATCLQPQSWYAFLTMELEPKCSYEHGNFEIVMKLSLCSIVCLAFMFLGAVMVAIPFSFFITYENLLNEQQSQNKEQESQNEADRKYCARLRNAYENFVQSETNMEE